jgi:predicted dehydrogenase
MNGINERGNLVTQLRIGVIGAGLAFQELHWPILRGNVERFRITAICSESGDSAKNAANSVKDQFGYEPVVLTDYHDVLKRTDVDAVLIAVPINLTPEIATAALESGRHVFAEKPLADNSAQFQTIMELAQDRHLTLIVGENFRYQRQFYQMRKLVEDGVIGTPRVYRLNDMHYTAPASKYAATRWRQEGKHRGGYLIDGGTHIVAGMRVMVNSPVVDIYGLLSSFNPVLFSHQPDTLLLNLRYANGMVGQMALGYGAMDKDARRPKIYGEKGTLALFGDRIEMWANVTNAAVQEFKLDSNGPGFQEEWLDFYESIVNGKELLGTAEDAFQDLRLIELGIRSALEGIVIKF